jgi:DNA-binding NtrC family response regulator
MSSSIQFRSPVSRGSGATSQPFVASVLVVGTCLTETVATMKTLTDCCFHVTLASTYEEARQRLVDRPLQLLVTELRLNEFNGLGLVLRANILKPNIAAVVLGECADAPMREEVEAFGATFVVKPCEADDLKAAVVRTILRRPSADGELPIIRPPFERRCSAPLIGDAPCVPERRVTDLRTSLSALADQHR